MDGRGFAWFHFDEVSSNVTKTTRQLALLFMMIFEFKADAGAHLARFTEWPIDQGFLLSLIERNGMLLKAERLAEPEQLAQLMRTAANYGFALTEGLARLVAAGHAVQIGAITDEELDANPALVKSMSVQPPRGTGRIRTIRIGAADAGRVGEAIDFQPCGGTHVANTGEIGAVVVTKIEKKSASTRRVVLGFA